jgi:meso-butanediol dehydrogenase/(S,S)-butanediol dehydrogenase/diacetyl reductase
VNAASKRFAGAVAVVTGGTRGIGEAIAERLRDEGAVVVTGSRSPGPIEAQAAHVEGDVSDPACARRLIERAVELGGGLDVLVNNAAVEYEGTVEQTSVEDWDRVMAVNLRGPFLCARSAIPHLRRRGGGAIVNVSSVDGLWAEPHLAAYCASKGGLLALTRALAIDHAVDNIRCNAVCPSYVRTDMLEQFYDAQPDPGAARAQAEVIHPLGRISEPAEVAAAVAWLASPEASFATGQSYVLDGGLTVGRPFSA